MSSKKVKTVPEEIQKLHDEKHAFIKNFPQRKTFTTRKGQTITRKLYSFEADYASPKTKEMIFTHGKTGYTLWFLNAKKKLCVIDEAIHEDDNIYLTITIDAKETKVKTHMTLDRFLSLVEKGDFSITMKKFVDTYLQPITQSNYYRDRLKEFDNKIAEAAINKS